MSKLSIRLLGDFQLSYADRPVTTVNQARQHLAFLFWPDTNEVQALTNLRNLVYKLRQALPQADQFLQADSQTIQWRADAPFILAVATK